MQKKAIVGSKILFANTLLDNHVLIFTDRIEAILTEHEFEAYKREIEVKIEIINFHGTIVPGFIDIHIHGANGFDVMDGTIEALDGISKAIVKTGTTAFLATTMTMSGEAIIQALDQIGAYMATQKSGAKLLGVHLEGPFINPIFKGAQHDAFIQKPTRTWLEPYLNIMRMITYAPEMDPGFAFAKSMKNTGIVLSIGHSGSDFETALEAYDEGVCHVTHCFNAMTGLHHRNPGVVGAALSKPFTLDVIADGVHIHPGFVGPFIKLKGTDKTILITDAMRAALMPEGDYDLGGQRVIVKDGACRLEDGTLAGSVLSTAKAISNLMKFSDITLIEAIKMLTENPAKLLGLFDEMGSLDTGKQANFVLLDEHLDINKVFIDGEIAYQED
jgi:N-acetylglucosamine-6-phosphate deacetylase